MTETKHKAAARERVEWWWGVWDDKAKALRAVEREEMLARLWRRWPDPFVVVPVEVRAVRQKKRASRAR